MKQRSVNITDEQDKFIMDHPQNMSYVMRKGLDMYMRSFSHVERMKVAAAAARKQRHEKGDPLVRERERERAPVFSV